ncbi:MULTISPECIES: hypothetical protein [unclassified Streptococcus]|jgi:hypothetical protein|uniref:hypothetical protein n=1 Tax=unclassified Streptococcus TaxID=2608887 RepID=UPI001020AA36|nr:MULTISPECIES: hypothetical protein [unclassified Streptococcus]MTQ42836.1 hypothetical protein [Streptococcus sp. BIOML-A1]RYS59272.1 hypothetical protein EAI95_09400 [Streptococcus sp. bf_0095]
MNKVIDDLLENVKKFEIFFNEYEKEFYPEIRKMRRRLVYSLLAMIIFYIIDLILFHLSSDFNCLKFISLFCTVVAIVLFWFCVRKFDNVSAGAPSKFSELCNEVKTSLKNLYGSNAYSVANMLLEDLSTKRNIQLKKYENIVQSIGTVGTVLVTAFITLILNRLFVTDKTGISFGTFLGLLALVAIIVILLKAIDGGIKGFIKYPIFGKASKEVYLSDVLSAVKYMLLEKEDN